MESNLDQPIKYCLYARKSTEGDERQAMSIDSQLKEMQMIAKRDGIKVVDIREERFSAKMSGSRPVFNSVLADIKENKFNAILTWAPDRLSRNAGDLGMLVDLMDQGKLQFIKTYSQTFTNNPNEKFLLMILCSQAKLENDNKGINVKRGIRAKCEMGWRPGMPPIGYYNRSFAGVKDIVIDPDRGNIITEMFAKVAEKNYSGRQIIKWFKEIKFTTRKEKHVSLSQVYLMLKNPFYYGEFEYPMGSGKWYKGSHKPLITKEVFDIVQAKLVVPAKAKWGSKILAYKGIFRCATCGSAITGEERFRNRKNKLPNRHVYYHCGKQKDFYCPEPPVTEGDLEKELVRYIGLIENVKPQYIKYSKKLTQNIDKYKSIREQLLLISDINPELTKFKFNDYVKYTMKSGAIE